MVSHILDHPVYTRKTRNLFDTIQCMFESALYNSFADVKLQK